MFEKISFTHMYFVVCNYNKPIENRRWATYTQHTSTRQRENWKKFSYLTANISFSIKVAVYRNSRQIAEYNSCDWSTALLKLYSS